MTLIGKNNRTQTEECNYKEFEIPATIEDNMGEISLGKAIIISLIIHPLAVGIVAAILVILSLMGIHLTLLQKPEVPMKDIEFVLVDKEQTPINKNTKFRADRNSRAGGINDPKRKVSLPSPEPKRLAKPKTGGSAPKQTTKKEVKKDSGNNIFKKLTKITQPSSAPSPKPKQNVPEVSVPLAPRPAVKPAAPKTTTKPTSPIVIPVAKTGIAPAKLASGGPITTSPTHGTGTGGNGSGSGTASPSFSPTASSGALGGNGRFSGSGAGSGTGTSSGYGNAGNPGPGNPNGRPGIDAVKQVDFGPYMRDLQRRIKANWNPPKGNESKRVVLLFSIAKDGRLLGVKVSKSSGLQAADRAAISAVQVSAPFKPLPSDYKKSSVDIEFTFDYSVFGVSGY